MKRTIVSAAVLTLLAGGASVASAAPGDGPGPNGKNDFGLCKAYQNGSPNKQDKGPFPALEEKASDDDDTTSPQEDVAAYCLNIFPGGKTDSPGKSGNNGGPRQ